MNENMIRVSYGVAAYRSWRAKEQNESTPQRRPKRFLGVWKRNFQPHQFVMDWESMGQLEGNGDIYSCH